MEVIPARLHSKNETRVQSGGFSGAVQRWTLKDVFRFFHCAWGKSQRALAYFSFFLGQLLGGIKELRLHKKQHGQSVISDYLCCVRVTKLFGVNDFFNRFNGEEVVLGQLSDGAAFLKQMLDFVISVIK